MLSRTLSALIGLAAAAVLLILTWPQLFGLQNAWVAGHIVSLRGLAVAAALVGVVVLLLLGRLRPLRRLCGMLAVLLVLYAGANAAVLAVRGVDTATTEPTGAAAGADPGAVTVLSWNTLGDAPGAEAIASLALEYQADIVALPETTAAMGEAVATTMREGGRSMWVHTIAFDQVSKSRSTTVLISPDLGDYRVDNERGSGPPGNTNVLPTVVATPVDGTGPTVIAVHAVAPIRWEMSNWRSDLDWLAEQCSAESVIMAGDFNATIDHMAGRSASGVSLPGAETAGPAVLGDCRDAALSTGSAGVGTWPTALPKILGSPIDHVLATPDWQVQRMTVIGSSDGAGSDHRPIVATLSPADR
jgi:endonuclease/exonuclease/phosphatase (EEP) superfamily protein YafD